MAKAPGLLPVVIADLFPPYINGIKLAFKYKEHIDLLPACNVQEILQHLEKNNNACVVLTYDMLLEFGNSCISRILEQFNAVKIIVLIHTCQVHLLKYLIASGVSALVSKYTKGPELEEAILHVRQSDEIFYCHRTLKLLASKTQIPEYIDGKKVSLSPRLVELLWHMIDDLPNKLITDEMDLQEGTVEDYRKIINARIKLSGCKSALEYAFRMGYFTMDHYVKRISDKKILKP